MIKFPFINQRFWRVIPSLNFWSSDTSDFLQVFGISLSYLAQDEFQDTMDLHQFCCELDIRK